jgi:hypothetical protein
MAAAAKGPIFAAGGFQAFSSKGYTLLFLPDIANRELQQDGQGPVYYWMPNAIRLAQKDGSGDYVFSFVHFEGVLSSSTTVGVTGDKTNETAGGVLAFSTTTAPPPDVLKDIQEQLTNAFKGSDDNYWGWRTPAAPQFRPVPIVANQTVVSNVSPMSDGSVPALAPAGTGGSGSAPSGATGTPPTGTTPAGTAPAGGTPPGGKKDLPPMIVPTRSLPQRAATRGVAARTYRGSNLDPMYMRVEGQGPGSVSPFAENAYSVICGSTEAAILWASFHNATSLLTLHQYMKLKVVSPEVTIKIHGNWKSIQAHLSAEAKYNGVFYSGDVQAAFNYMRKSGDIEVTVFVDQTLPNWEKIQESVDKRSDLVFQKFMELAQKVIFDPAPFNEKPAEASGGLFGGVAIKMRADFAEVNLDYSETRQFTYLQDYVVSGDLGGLYDEIKANPEAEKKYFTTVYLSDWDRKLSRIVKPVVNWPDRGQKWVGEPVAFLSVQVGYPNTQGEIQWDGHVFQPSDGPDAAWTSATEQKKLADVSKPPAGWSPDKTYIKRRVHFTEPPSADEFPFARIAVEKNIVELDDGDYGTLSDDTTLEVRVDNVGALSVGPIDLSVVLDGDKQVVEVELVALGKTWDNLTRTPVRFRWAAADQSQSRHWMLFTGQPTFTPKYQYRVTVTVKGTLFSKGMQWQGPWVDAAGNGPLIVTVPMQDDPGVTITKGLPPTLQPTTPTRLPPPAQPRVPPPRSVPPTASDRGWAMTPEGATARSAPPQGDLNVVFSGFVPAP